MKGTNAFMVILGIYLAATAITTIVLMVKASNNVEEDTALFNDLKNNFSSNTIEAITISFEPCQAPFTPLFPIAIDGRKGYCQCYGSLYFKSMCSKKSYNCNQISSKPSFNVYSWRGVYLCGLRSLYNYDTLAVASDNKCPPNFQICGNDTSIPLCYPASAPCPVNDIVFSDESKPELEAQNYTRYFVSGGLIHNADGSTTKPKFSSSQSQSGNFYIYYTNNKTENSLIVDFKLGYSAICANPKEEKAPIVQNNLLDKNYVKECKDTVGGLTENPHFKQVATINKKALWTENNVFLELGSIPKFDINSLNYDMGLFSRSYVHFEQKCLTKINNKTGKNYTKSGFMDRLAMGNTTSIFSYTIAICVLAGIITCCSCVFCTVSIDDSSKKSEKMFFIHCIILFVIVVGVLVAILLARQIPTYSLVKTLKDDSCGDKLMNGLTSGESTNSKKTANLYIIILSLLGFGFLMYLVLLFLKDSPTSQDHAYTELAENRAHQNDNVHHLNDTNNEDFYNDDKPPKY